MRAWGRAICSRVWNFDTECIESTGDYLRIVKRLCEVAGLPGLLENVEDLVDLKGGNAWLKYRVDGADRHWTVEVCDDWADTLTISYIMEDIQRGGGRFYCKDNGQAMVLFYLDEASAAELNSRYREER